MKMNKILLVILLMSPLTSSALLNPASPTGMMFWSTVLDDDKGQSEHRNLSCTKTPDREDYSCVEIKQSTPEDSGSPIWKIIVAVAFTVGLILLVGRTS